MADCILRTILPKLISVVGQKCLNLCRMGLNDFCNESLTENRRKLFFTLLQCI